MTRTRTFTQLTEAEKQSHFYLPRPRLLGFRSWSLLVPSLFSALGFGAFAVLAYSFTEVRNLPVAFRRIIILVGAFSLAIGAELGTLPAIVEIFRKAGSKGIHTVRTWDWIGLGISLVATIMSFIFAFATILGEATNWSRSMQVWGSIAIGLAAALDSYVNFAEFGLYLSTFDDRIEAWDRQYASWRKEMAVADGWTRGTVAVSPVQVVQPVIATEEAADAVYVNYLHTDMGMPVPEIQSTTGFTMAKILGIIRKENVNV